jgi:hypothetical protein
MQFHFLFLFRVVGICFSLPQSLLTLPQPSDDIFNEQSVSSTLKAEIYDQSLRIHSQTGNIFVL